jgi:hypothetical protein
MYGYNQRAITARAQGVSLETIMAKSIAKMDSQETVVSNGADQSNRIESVIFEAGTETMIDHIKTI